MFDFLKKRDPPPAVEYPTVEAIAVAVLAMLPEPVPQAPQVVFDGPASLVLLTSIQAELKAANDLTVYKLNPDDPQKLLLIGIRGGKS